MLKLRPTSALLGLLALACGGAKDAPSDDTSAENGGGDNGGGDNGGGDDTGGDNGGGDNGGGDNGGGDAGPCPDYSGYHASGAEWVWGYTEAYSRQYGIEGGWVTTLTSLGGGGAFSIEMIADYSSDSVRAYTSTQTMSGFCDAEGAWYDDAYLEYRMVLTDGSVYEGWVETDYDEPYLGMPAGVEGGDELRVTYSGTSRTHTGTNTPFSTTYTWRFVEEEPVTVPAGTFTAMRTELVMDSSTTTTWIERDVGGVGNDVSELLSYTP